MREKALRSDEATYYAQVNSRLKASMDAKSPAVLGFFMPNPGFESKSTAQQ